VNRRSSSNTSSNFSCPLWVPTLGKGEVVLMDNLNSHKNLEVRRAIRATGAKLWLLPAYNPDVNPIEQAFAKLKALLRMADGRTFDDVCEHLAKLLDEFRPEECASYLRKAGYAGRLGAASGPVST
jgi:transposase